MPSTAKARTDVRMRFDPDALSDSSKAILREAARGLPRDWEYSAKVFALFAHPSVQQANTPQQTKKGFVSLRMLGCDSMFPSALRLCDLPSTMFTLTQVVRSSNSDGYTLSVVADALPVLR